VLWKRVITVIFFVIVTTAARRYNYSWAEEEQMADFLEFSIEELMDVEVTTVLKKKQKLFDTAAAIYVITQDDICRSGVTSVPEALRLAPALKLQG